METAVTKERTSTPTTTGRLGERRVDLDHVFSYHAPSVDQQAHYTAIREQAKRLANVIETVCPAGADRTDAIRKLREVVMTANAAIALKGKLYLDETQNT